MRTSETRSRRSRSARPSIGVRPSRSNSRGVTVTPMTISVGPSVTMLERRDEREVALEPVEGLVHLLEVLEVRGRQRVARPPLLGRITPDVDQPFAVTVGQRLDQHAVDDGEDRAGRADAQRQREDRQRR